MRYKHYGGAGRARKVVLGVALAAAAVGGIGGGAQALGGGAEVDRPRVVAAGVTVGGVALAGLTKGEAAKALRREFGAPLTLRHRGRTWRFAPQTLGARPAVPRAVAEALAAPTGAALDLPVLLDGRRLQRWARRFARDFDRLPVDAAVVLHGLRPWLTKEHAGRRLDRVATQMRVAAALRAGEPGPIPLAVHRVRPALTTEDAGPAIVIRRGSNRLFLYRGAGHKGMRLVRALGVATGQAIYPTPLGSFTIATMQRDPWWYPPDSDWAAGAAPVPPGPGNPLGTRWMGLSEPLVGIHGTPDEASIGYSASHGCIRMRIADAEWLFERVEVGTPVFILAA